MTTILVISFFLGTAIGSFVNVLVLRKRKNEPINGRSYCPHCKKQLNWYELIPLVSFTLQKGRCRKCGNRISWQYPIVEAGTGLLFALFSHYFIYSSTILIWLWFVSLFLVALFVFDIKYLELPDAWVLVLTLLMTAGALIFYRDTIVVRALSGLALTFFFYALYSLSKGRWIGGGDVKIAFGLGMFVSWPGILVLMGLAYVSGAFVGIILLAQGKAKKGTALPFGPFLIGASVVSFLYSEQIIQWYLSLLT